MRAALPLIALLALAGCGPGGGEVARPARAAPAPPIPVPATALAAGVDRVQGQTAPRLIAQFGPPQIDLQEGAARKLQFTGPICVLDAYLYRQGRAEAVVTHIDTRQRDGTPIDQASCVLALTKR
ncbi:MAG: hypothetical protein V4574_09055 [Pseudomonadota bacterium]